MIMVYQMNGWREMISRMKAYIGMVHDNFGMLLENWQDGVQDQPNSKSHPGPVTQRNVKGTPGMNVKVYNTTTRGKMLLAMSEKMDRVVYKANRLEEEHDNLKASVSLHASNMKAEAHPQASTNPYTFLAQGPFGPQTTSTTRSTRSFKDRPSEKIQENRLAQVLSALNHPENPGLRILDREMTDEIEKLCNDNAWDCQIERDPVTPDSPTLQTENKILNTDPNPTDPTFNKTGYQHFGPPGPGTHYDLTFETHHRQKRFFGILNFIGVVINGKRLDSLGHKVETLLENERLQDRQIHHIANYLNMTMVKVVTMARNQIKIERYIHDLADTLDRMANKLERFQYFMEHYAIILSEIDSLDHMLDEEEDGISKMRHTLMTIQTHQLSALVISPYKLRNHLNRVSNDLNNKPRLRLPGNYKEDIWSFYSVIKVYPILTENSVILVCSIPLVDVSTDLDLYRVHNLPAVSVETQISVKYVLEGNYFAITKNRDFVAIPQEDTMLYCESTRQHVCHLNAPLIPRDKCTLCVCAMFDDIKQDQTERIRRDCFVTAREVKGSQAVNLEGNVWAVVPDRETVLLKHCHDKPERVKITPPVTFVNLTGGCSAFTKDLYLTSQTHITNIVDVIDRWSFMKFFEKEITVFQDLRVWEYFPIQDGKLKEILAWKAEKLPFLPNELPLGELDQHIKEFSMKDFWQWGK